MLSLKGISKVYGKLTVLDNAQLEVGSEIKALIGTNGSGKSTLLKIVAGIIQADQGTVKINEKDVTKMMPEARNIGYVPQHPALFRHLSIQDNVRYGMRHGRGSETVYEQVIEMLDLGDVLQKKPKELSGGYQHRASLARALVPEPKVLLLDEPLCGMDMVLKEKILPEFRKVLKYLEVPVLFVTHDPEEASLVADSYAAIVKGKVSSIESASAAFHIIKDSQVNEFMTPVALNV